MVTETDISSPTTAHCARRATWEPKPRKDSDPSTIDEELIPDYVRNYIRGETPETIARRKLKGGGKLGERLVDVGPRSPRHQNPQPQTTDFEGFYQESTSDTSLSVDEENQYTLPRWPKGSDRGWKKLAVGWRGGVTLNVLLAFTILVAVFVSLILAISKASLFAGESVIFSGSCTIALNINQGLHAAVNVFAVVTIAGANYVFQVLSSPTRAEVDAAHKQRKWLDIGIPSVRNFAHISASRTILAIVILFAALATQVIYNAVIFTTQTAPDYPLVFVTQSFLDRAPFSNETANNAGGLNRLDILSLQDLAAREALVNLTTTKCLVEFGGAAIESDFKAVLLVTDVDSPSNSLIQTATAAGSPSLNQLLTKSSTGTDLALDSNAIQFCLAQPAGEQVCSVRLNGSLLGIVTLLNLISVICMAVVIFRPSTSFDPLVSLGDALSSFLQNPDQHTRGSCLMTKMDVLQGRWGFGEAKYWVPQEHFWFRTPSLRRWFLAIFFWVTLTALSTAGLILIARADPSAHLAPFGTASRHAIYRLLPTSYSAGPDSAGAALIASLPQLLLGALYFSVNSLMTTYYLSHESSLLALGDSAPLRVSSSKPEGSQTTSLYLTLPRPWSWFLAILFTVMGFILSQSTFVVVVKLIDPSTSSSSSSDTTTLVSLGFSSAGLLILLSLLFVLSIAVLGLGFRRSPRAVLVNGQAAGNPLALPGGSCSAVFSARCHPIPREKEIWERPVAWGVVVQNFAGSEEGGMMNVGHCTYTAGGAAQLDVARSYA